MGALVVYDNQTGRQQTFRDQDPGGVLDTGLRTNRFTALRQDGNAAQTYAFEGGVLVDGAPLNAWLFDVWFTGQKEILEPFFRSGEIVRPPDYIYQLPTVDPPQEIVQTYAEYKGVPEAQTITEAYNTGGAGGIFSNPWVLGAIGVGFLLLISGGGRKTSQPAGSDFDL